MKTDNQIIAEFMGERIKLFDGVPRIKTSTDGLRSLWSELQYDTSWNQLMPVVEKIEGLYSKTFPSNDEFVRRIMAKEDPIDDHYMNVIALPLATKIDEAHKAVITFIKWHNSTLK